MVEVTGGDGIERHLTELEDKRSFELKVGFLSGATYPDGTSVPLVAAINEFGAPSRGQPPRPFMRNMIAEKSGAWGEDIAKVYKAIGGNPGDEERAMDLMGQRIKAQLQESIRNLTDPPIKATTAAAKGFDKPLIDTGHMLNSVDYRVEES